VALCVTRAAASNDESFIRRQGGGEGARRDRCSLSVNRQFRVTRETSSFTVDHPVLTVKTLQALASCELRLEDPVMAPNFDV
jgi:hypothetical protein